MAKDNPSIVRLCYTWSTGDRLDVIVQAPSPYPDALDEARATAHREFHEALDKLATLEELEPESDG